MIGQMFVQIHQDPACAKMHAHFVNAYVAASDDDVRKPPQFERLVPLVAVA